MAAEAASRKARSFVTDCDQSTKAVDVPVNADVTPERRRGRARGLISEIVGTAGRYQIGVLPVSRALVGSR